MESRPGRRDRWLDIPSGGVGGSFKRLHSFAAQSRESREMRLIKAAERAVEKARACYGGDPSHLLDICRARLIFGTAAELAAGLSAVLDSAAAPVPNCGAVRVVRVRNSLREDCDAASTCGFRVCPPPAGSTCAPPVEALRWAPVKAPVFACACASPAVVVCFA